MDWKRLPLSQDKDYKVDQYICGVKMNMCLAAQLQTVGLDDLVVCVRDSVPEVFCVSSEYWPDKVGG